MHFWKQNKVLFFYFHFIYSDPIKAAELAFERAAEAAARAAEMGEIEEEEDTGPKPILPYSSFFILSSTNPWVLSLQCFIFYHNDVNDWDPINLISFSVSTYFF